MKPNSSQPMNPTPVTAKKSRLSPIWAEMKFPIQYPKLLAEIPIHIVAGIGAKLQMAKADPVGGIRLAYTLLDAAAAAQESLKNKGCVNPGLFKFELKRVEAKLRPQIFAEWKDDSLYQEKNGVAAPVPLDKAVLTIFGGAIKKSERERRVFLYLTENAEKPSCDQSFIKGKPSASVLAEPSAKETMDSWKRDGIPFGKYRNLKEWIPKWWKTHLSRIQSAKRAGKTKQAAKGKQGRVVKKKDKRKGSRA